MEDLLTPVSTAYTNSKLSSNEALIEVQEPLQDPQKSFHQPSTPEESLDILRAEPDLHILRDTLKYLVHDAPSISQFQIKDPSPMAAQIINVLVSNIIPNYWAIFKETVDSSSGTAYKHGSERKLLLSCLQSVSGLNAVLARLRALIQIAKEASKTESRQSHVEILEDNIDVLKALLHGENFISRLWKDLCIETIAKRRVIWHEVAAAVGGGKVLNSVAEATSLISDASMQIQEPVWIADGIQYSRWLAQNIICWFKDFQNMPKGPWNPFAELFSKSIRLGYPGRSTLKTSLLIKLMQSDVVLDEILALPLRGEDERKQFEALLSILPNYEQKLVLDAALKTLSKRYLSKNVLNDGLEWWRADADLIAGATGYLKLIISTENSRKSHLIDWLTSFSGAGVGEAIGIRRAAIAVLSYAKDDVESVLEKSLQQFGDQLYIRHAPSLQQEGI